MLRPGRALLALPVTLLVLAAGAGPAAAAPLRTATGGLELRLRGTAWTTLERQGVRVVAVDPVTLRRGRLTVPARDGRVTGTARIRHAGVVPLRARRGGRTRRLTLTGLETAVGRRATTCALVGGERGGLLSATGARPGLSRARGRVDARGTVHLTAAGARLVRSRLALRRVSRGALATSTLTAQLAAAGGGGEASTGSGVPASAVPSPVPPVVGGTPITGTALTWRPRESWIRYIATGEGTTASAGASDGPREVRGSSALPLVYSFPHTSRTGSRDDASGTTTAPFGGAVRYRFDAHGIDLSLVDPTITLRGATGSLSVVYDGPTAGTARGSRVDMLSLDLGAVVPSTAGGTTTYADVPAVLTAEGAAAFQGFYAAGAEWGTVTVSVPAR